MAERFIVIFDRHKHPEREFEATLEEAIAYIRALHESNAGYGIGVYDVIENTVHIPETEPFGKSSPDYRFQRIRAACGLSNNHTFSEIKAFRDEP